MDDVTSPIAVLFLLILVFLVCREVMCWYWKINQVVELLASIKQELQKRDGSSTGSDKKVG